MQATEVTEEEAVPPDDERKDSPNHHKGHPHTVSWLAVMLAVLSQLVFFPYASSSSSSSPEQDLRRGLLAACGVFLFYCSLQLQDGELQKPHVVVWRLVHGITILYLLFIVLLLTQNSAEMVDRIVQLVFNEQEAGRAPLPKFERNDYSENCALTANNVLPRVLDRYFWAHLLGWIVKALILRDWQMMWACSLMFEVLEVSLQRLMPNFSECWWDRWLLDVLGCNLVGMCIGMRIASLVGAQEYDWQGKRRNWLKKMLPRPDTFRKRFDWHVFGSWRYFAIAVSVLFVVMLGELNGFFIKSALCLGNQSWLILWRIIFLVPAVYAAVVELYAFAEQRTDQIGRTAWLLVCLGVLEFALAMKQFTLRRAFEEEGRRYSELNEVHYAWLGSLACAVVMLALKLAAPSGGKAVTRLVGRLAVVPFAMLLAHDAWEFGGLKQQVNELWWWLLLL